MGKKFGKKVRKKRKILKSKFTSSFPITDVDDVRNVHSEEDDDSEREMCLDDAHRLSSLANTRYNIIEQNATHRRPATSIIMVSAKFAFLLNIIAKMVRSFIPSLVLFLQCITCEGSRISLVVQCKQ